MTIARATIIGFMLLGLGIVGTELTMGELLDRAIAERTESAAGLQIAARVSERIVEHNRLNLLYAATEDAAVAATREEARDDVRRLLDDAERGATTPREHRLVEETQKAVERYLDKVERSRTSREAAAENIAHTRHAYEAAVTAVRHLHDANQDEWDEATVSLAHVRRVSSGMTLGVVFLLLLGAAVLVQVVRRYGLRPVLNTAAAIELLEKGAEGGRGVPLSEDVPAELQALVRALNDLRDRLARQRQNELAYLASVAHDLRNPLGALKSGVALVRQKTPPDERLTKTLDIIDRQVDRLNRMVGDLLEMARIESGRLQLERERCDLRQVVRDAADLYSPTTAQHELSVVVPEAPVVIECDAMRIEQVLGNLITNAIKYSPQGGRVQVRVAVDNGEAVISVSDEGVGIPPDAQRDIFAPFWRRRPHARVSGVGLGLSVVRTIVEAHGGRVDVESTPGIGSTFFVHLPIGPSRSAAVEPSHPVVPS